MEYDPSRFYHTLARYSPRLQRFLSDDPLASAAVNLFAFARNRPRQ